MGRLPQIKERGTLTQQTYDTLHTAIVELDLKPGSLLLEEELSRDLGVSRTPIRAAINQLALEGLVETVPGRGTIVSPLNTKKLLDLFAIRRGLERLSVEQCCRNAPQEQLEELHRAAGRELETCRRGEHGKKEFVREDIAFHVQLASLSGNLYLPRYIQQILSNTSRFIYAFTSDHMALLAASEHEELCRLICERKEKEAVARVLEHVAAVEMRTTGYQKTMEQNEAL